MLKQYIKQAWRGFSENKLQSRLTILGTALSICMIMVLVLVDEVKYGPFPPEIHRREMLIVKQMVEKSSENWSMSGVGERSIKEFFTDLKTTKRVAFHTFSRNTIGLPDQPSKGQYFVTGVSEQYWDFFDFKFIAGTHFTAEETTAGISLVVLSDKLASELFGQDDAVGKEILLGGNDRYKVVGVVKRPQRVITYAYGDIWVPYTSPAFKESESSQSYVGAYNLFLMPDGNGGKKEIAKEVQERVKYFNSTSDDIEIDLLGAPDDFRTASFRLGLDPVDLTSAYRKQFVLLALFFLVPAVNIASLTHSRMKKRIGEIGIRKAYGANNRNILNQVVWESLLYTLIGTAIGFVCSVIAIYTLQEMLFGEGNIEIPLWTLIRLEVIAVVIITAVLLNMVSAIVPALLASRRSIIDALERR